MKQYRVYRCGWQNDKIVKTIMYLNEQTYKFVKETQFKPVKLGYSNLWFEDHPYKWCEFHFLKVFFRKIRTSFIKRYATEVRIIQYIRDVSVAIIAGLFLWLLIEIIKNWIENHPK